MLQLSKSAKDVPDTAVFKGDLDQVRTVAEQAEPESEPRADTIRGSAALLRAISTSRQKRQLEEAKKLQEEHMQPIGENEEVEIDGLRRRRTIVQPQPGSLSRRKTLHPPLGLTHFPDDEEHNDADDDHHPGFSNRRSPSYSTWIGRIRSLSNRTPTAAPHTATFPLDGLNYSGREETLKPPPQPYPHSTPSSPGASQSAHGAGGVPTSPSAIRWGSTPDPKSDSRARSPHLQPPPPPPHSARRQFSFQNVFSRSKSHDSSSGDRDGVGFLSGRSSSRSGNRTTEEERLGLVHGDSRTTLAGPAGAVDGAGSDSDDSLADDLPSYKSDPDDRDDDAKSFAVAREHDSSRRHARRKDDDGDGEKYHDSRGRHERDGYF